MLLLGKRLVRGFEKGLAERGHWREEIRPMPEIQVSFLHPLSYSSLRRRWTQFWGTIFAAFGALSVANPLPPTPFRNLLKEANILGQNRLQQGRSNLVDPVGCPKIGLLNRDFGSILSAFPRKKCKTQSSLNFLQSRPGNLVNLIFQHWPRSGGF